MLPSFPKLERHRSRANNARIRQLVRAMAPMVAAVSQRVQHEGNGFYIERQSDEHDEVEPTAISASLKLTNLRLADLIPERCDAMLKEIAMQMARGQTEMMVDKIRDVTERTGNVVEGGGKPFTAEMFIDVIETMEHSFDERGNWKAPTFFGGPARDEAFAAEMKKALESPRLKAVIDRKKDEWRRREIARVLVG